MVIDLDDIVDAIQGGSNSVEYYLNTRTGEIIMRDDRLSVRELNDIDDELDKVYDSILLIPTSRDAGDIRMMREFTWTLPDGQAKDALTTALGNRKGIFQRFRNVLNSFNLLNDWYEYEDDRYMEFARNWCRDNEVAFEEVPKIVYRRAVRSDVKTMVELRKKELGLAPEDDSFDFELDRYFAAQMRNGALYEIFAWWKKRIVACGAIAWVFTPPTPELPDGRNGYLCNFWCDEEVKGNGYEKEILSRLLEEAKRRKLPVVRSYGLDAELVESFGFKPEDDVRKAVLKLK